jgi:hypothetical protein
MAITLLAECPYLHTPIHDDDYYSVKEYYEQELKMFFDVKLNVEDAF